MALSGTIYGSTVGGGYRLEIDWSATQSTSANTSTITMNVYWHSLGSGYTISSSATKTGSTSMTASVGTNSGSDSWSVAGASLSGNQRRLLHTFTHTVTHDANGNWSGTLASTFNCEVQLSTYVSSASASGSVTLNQIPRKSVLSGSIDFTAGNNLTVNITRYSSSFTHHVTLYTQDTSSSYRQIGSTATGVGTSYTFDLTSNAPNANSTSVFTSLAQRSSCTDWVRIETFDGSTSLGYNDYYGTCTAPAATTATAPNFNIGSAVTITLNPANSAFTHKLEWSWVSYNTTINGSVSGTSYSWNTASTDSANSDTFANLMYKQIPNDQSDWGTLKCTTYYGGVQVQSPQSTVDIYGTVVNSNPTFTSTGITYKDNTSAISTITGNNQYIVQNASDLLVSLPTTSNATPKNFATMSYYTASLGGVTKQTNYSSSATITFDLGQINLTANGNIVLTAFDSRGFSTQVTIPVNIVPWKPPAITSTSKRADGFSNPTNITLSGSYSKVTIGGTDKNAIVSAKYQYKKTTDSGYPASGSGALTAFPGFTSGSGTFSTSPTLSVSLDNTLAWNTEVQVLDKIQQALAQSASIVDNTVSVGAPLVFFDTLLESVGINQFPSGTNTFESSNEIIINKQGDGAELLKFNTERAWAFLQSATGASTNLDLKSLTNSKSLRITSPNKVAMNIYADDTNPSVSMYGAASINDIGLTPNAGQSTPGNNLNTTYTVGRYTFDPSTTGAPISAYGTVDIIVSNGGSWNGSNNWIWQIAYTTDASVRVFIRNRVNSGGWGSWIERTNQLGSNGNGSYLRFGNGIQICWMYGDFTNIGISSSYGSLYQGTMTWTFPAAFKSGTIPTCLCSEFKYDTGASWGAISSVSTATNTVLRGIDAFTRAASSSIYVHIGGFAIGYWF